MPQSTKPPEAPSIPHPPHQMSNPDPLPEHEQAAVEQQERDAVRRGHVEPPKPPAPNGR